MSFRTSVTANIRQAPATSDASQTTRDLEESLSKSFGRLLTVSTTQTLAGTGLRLFSVDAPQTDLVDLVAGADNVIPHGLRRPVKEVFLTPVGAAAGAVSLALKDPATLTPPLDASTHVCLRVTNSVTARVRVL